MHNIPKPDIDFHEYFVLCANRFPEFQELLSKLPVIAAAAMLYDCKAADVRLHELQSMSDDDLHPVTPDILRKLYTSQVVARRGRGRGEYDRILANSKKNHCCFCSYEEPTELDHFLPKTIFPEFSILPINLVPSCNRCNRLKGKTIPKSEVSSYIHPYYEECANFIWLEAELEFDFLNRVVITYSISQAFKAIQTDLAARVEYHCSSLNLFERYSLQACTEITGIFYRLQKLKNDAGEAAAVRNHLMEELQSREVVNKNSWQSALYRAMYRSDRCCSMNWCI